MPKADPNSPAYKRALKEWLGSDAAAETGAFFVGSGVIHGLRRTPTYETWANLKRRWARKEITLDAYWASDFRHFLDAMGEKPEGYRLRRLVDRGDYGPKSCIWRPEGEVQAGVNRMRFDPHQQHFIDQPFFEWHKRTKQ